MQQISNSLLLRSAIVMCVCFLYYSAAHSAETLYITSGDFGSYREIARAEAERRGPKAVSEDSIPQSRLPADGLQLPIFLVFGDEGCLAGVHAAAELDLLNMDCLPNAEHLSLSYLLSTQRPGTQADNFGLSEDGNNVVVFYPSMVAMNCRACATAETDLRAALRESGFEASIALADMRP